MADSITGDKYITPAELSKRWGINLSKIIGWIKAGELRAINVAQRAGGRPRWRIAPSDLAAFEASRAAFSSAPRPTVRRRRADAPTVKSYV